MHDIRQVLNRMTPADRKLWSEARNQLRSAFIATHGAVAGNLNWEESDDLFIDYLDIKLIQLFIRAERYAPDEETANAIMRDQTDIATNTNGVNALEVAGASPKPTDETSKADLDELSRMIGADGTANREPPPRYSA